MIDESLEPLTVITLVQKKVHNEMVHAFLHSWASIIYSFIVAVLVTGIFCWGAKRREMIPAGIQNVLEFCVEMLEHLILTILGPQGMKYLPFLGTLFIYILSMNIFGLFPLMASPSSNINVTIAQAILVFFLVQYLSIKQMGLKGFVYHMAGSPKSLLQWCFVPLLLPIELLTQFSRPLTLAFRLFGNIFGEEVLIGYFALLGVTLVPMIYPLALPLQLPFLFLALFTSVIQALVFTLLTAVYILLSIPEESEHH
jgi:F-type H+-transporting ATPase subunit a